MVREKEKVVVGISGGVDSFMTVRLLQAQGYDVVGVHLHLWGTVHEEKLERIARDLGITVKVVEARSVFKTNVVRPFVEGYLQGYTPNPCAICNNTVKWSQLLVAADAMGIEKVATGHYVNIEKVEGVYYITKGIDPNKDQSYFLWGMTQEVLRRSLTPLGSYTKAMVKEMAREQGFRNMADQAESMGICFLQGVDYRSFIMDYTDKKEKEHKGVIRLRTGEVVGEHDGLLNYTIGQKRGIPLWEGQPLYVAEINRAVNELTVDRKTGLMERVVKVGAYSIRRMEDVQAADLVVKVRGLGLNPEGYAHCVEITEKYLKFELDGVAWALAEGQPVALYRGNRLIGGGILVK